MKINSWYPAIKLQKYKAPQGTKQQTNKEINKPIKHWLPFLPIGFVTFVAVSAITRRF